MFQSLVLLAALADGSSVGPVMSVQSPGSQGMSHASYAPSRDEGARRLCLVEKATGRTVCRRMDAWRAIERRLEREQAGKSAG